MGMGDMTLRVLIFRGMTLKVMTGRVMTLRGLIEGGYIGIGIIVDSHKAISF